MQQLIDDLKSIPGVIGAYIYHPNEGIRSNNLPPLFKTERMRETAKSLVKITAAGRHSFHDLADTFLNFEESSILCRQLSGSNFVIAVCDPEINFNVLTMSLNLAMEDVNSRIAAHQFVQAENSPPSPAPATPPVTAPTMATPSPSAAAQPSPGNLKEELDVVGQTLAKFLGPMAKIVFDDVVENWSQGRTPTRQDFPALIDALCQEIADPEKEKSFRGMVREHIPFAF
ncbi:MAG: hypothetical protein GXY54_09125 [Deltaproteobacteria bacterium]|nr:hypothetical protein [Deltaproteobacteria bacterium]